MAEPRIIQGLREVDDRHDALLCDAWGVIHDGQRLLGDSADALVRWRAERGPVVVITNAPRLSDVIPAQLDRIGLPREAYDAIVTSGDATRAEVTRRADTAFFRLGPAKDDDLFAATGKAFVPLEDADAILCTGLMDDLNETPDDYREELAGAAERGLPMICANPDRVVRYGDRLMYCAGALADLYEEAGGEVIMAGKPHAPIYRLALEAARAAGPANAPLCVGDSVRTDLTGAARAGLEAVFVAGGVSLDEVRGTDGRLDERAVRELLMREGAKAAYAMEAIAW